MHSISLGLMAVTMLSFLFTLDTGGLRKLTGVAFGVDIGHLLQVII